MSAKVSSTSHPDPFPPRLYTAQYGREGKKKKRQESFHMHETCVQMSQHPLRWVTANFEEKKKLQKILFG